MARLSVALALLLVCAAQLAAAYPSLWAKMSPCGQQPTTGEGDHAAPKPDPTIKFSFADAAGKPAAKLCPGVAYTVTASFPQPRFAYLTAGPAAFAKSAGTKCPTSAVYDKTTGATKAASQSGVFTVPCSATAPVVFKITSATGPEGGFLTGAATVNVNPACKKC